MRWRDDERALGTSHSIVAGLNLWPFIITRSRHLDVLVLLFLLDVNTLSEEPL